jgi:V8-like Glu-specific endopeptidase
MDPYRRICHLSITAGDGSAFLGTGFFIGPRTIITAGHCVYDRDHGGWPQQIIVSPGRNGSSKPFGQFTATNFCSVEGWTQNQDRDCDYGVIQLAKNDNVPPVGSFGFGVFSDQALQNKVLRTAGYPGDKRGDEYGTMWFGSKIVKAVTPTTIVYDIDTIGGQSGSAVYDESNHVVGIHTNGNLDGNSATRITQSVFNNLQAWRSEGGAS